MNKPLHTLLGWALLAAASVAAVDAAAMRSGQTPEGLPYAMGGVTYGELRALHGERQKYSLWLVTAVARSGAYLADVKTVIRGADGRVVFDGVLDGPWLFIDLPRGRYAIEATFEGEMQRRMTTIHAGDHHQVFFYFDTGEDVGPGPRGPFEGNPFDGSRH